jgi:hypothetical protein
MIIIRIIKMLLAVVIGVIYIPLNLLLIHISEIYQKRRKTNPVEFWTVRILIFPLWGIVAILSAPYEILVESAH